MYAARNKTLYLAARVSGNVAFQIQSVAVGWHVYALAHRPLDLGLVGLALFLPSFLFALSSGIYADRHDRRHVARFCGIGEALGTLGILGLVVAHVTTVPYYLAILFGIGIARAFGAPAVRSLLPALVPPSDYLRTQAAFSSISSIVSIGGPALGGLFVALSVPLAFGVSAALDLAAALVFGVLVMTPVAKPKVAATWRDAVAGLHFVRRQPVIAGAITLDLFAVLFGGATALLPAYADTIFHVGPTGLGYMRAAPALGAAIVALVIARRPLERNVGTILLATVTGFGIATIVFGLSRNFALSLASLAFVGGTDMVSVVIRSGLVQLATPDAMRGRVNAVENVFIGASNELGEFESGTLAALIGVVPAVVAGGIGTLAIIALWGAFFPALRKADRFVEAAEPA